ncbi:OTU family cysteine protease [Toxoplasma gondii p89]|uniref:Ubiquitin thioesterase OTU n=1 Tax=Toxoplasma gondii p89 TaxID=943119 RepID=A0A086JJ99_TOXGO|nr:OTU family cysteine protease [Toxoplasma gondii p89]
MEVIVRCSNTRHRLILPTEATVEDLLVRVHALTGLSPARQVLKVGFPPQLVCFARGSEQRLVDAGVHAKDVIIVEERKGALNQLPEESLAPGRGPEERIDACDEKKGEPPKDRKELDEDGRENLHAPGKNRDVGSSDRRSEAHSQHLGNARTTLVSGRLPPSSSGLSFPPSGVRTPEPSAGSPTPGLTEPLVSSSQNRRSESLAARGRSAGSSAPVPADGGGRRGTTETPSEKKARERSREAVTGEIAQPGLVGEVFRFVVPSDNSCLFTCLSLLAAPDKQPQDLRDLVAAVIAGDPESFSSAILGKPRQEYIHWISEPTSWGGYVELAILAQQLRHEVLVVDVETRRKDFYGDRGTGKRIYLLYDGVHYDAVLALPRQRAFPGEFEKGEDRRGGGALFRVGAENRFCFCVFSPDDAETEAKVVELASELQRKRSFVNLKEMSLLCLVCGVGIRDQDEMRAHAKETGHANFEKIQAKQLEDLEVKRKRVEAIKHKKEMKSEEKAVT